VANPTLSKGSRITGTQRDALAARFAKKYESGQSIRKIVDDSGRSYGFVHGLLSETGVELRGRGGATRGTKKTPAKKSTAKKASTTKNAAGKTGSQKSAANKTAAKKTSG
jgi:hypothetical protein